MNLSSDPWIPVVLQDGTVDSVSLEEAFERGPSIRDLIVRPHERIALMRLFLCIAHAALDRPEDRETRVCVSRLIEAAKLYLSAQRSNFELFGKGSRFLQVEDLATTNAANEKGSVSKLDLALATGNNSTLFDNSGGSNRKFPPARLALMLLTYQCFSPGGTIGVALWLGKPTLGWTSFPKPAPGQSNHSPCVAGGMLHAFPRRSNLVSTIHLNLCSEVEKQLDIRWGRPVWEMMPTSLDDEPAIINATRTYLGRLVPISRAIRLTDNGDLLLANGLDYPSWPEIREASATIVVRKIKGKPDQDLLRASLYEAPWRVLNALTVKTVWMKGIGGPIALDNLSENEAFDLWVGALVVDKAKVLDTVEGVYHLPATMLLPIGQQRYEQGIRFAKAVEIQLKKAVSNYRQAVGDNLERVEMRDRRQALQYKATFQYWTQAERMWPRLIDAVKSSEPLQEQREWVETSWGQALRCFAREAYQTVCPHETARQIQAFVKGLSELSPKY